jgi:RNA polymerase sigma-70 factor (ECF subfamily)
MGESPTSRTSVSLLARIRGDPSDQHAWREFVQRYAPKIYRWCMCRVRFKGNLEPVLGW